MQRIVDAPVDGIGRGPTAEPSPGAAGADLVRVAAVALALVTVPIAVIAVPDPAALGLGRGELIVFVITALSLHLGIAALPWGRLVGTTRGVRLVCAYIGAVSALIVTATAMADPPSSALPWFLLVVAIVSGLTLPRLAHAVLSGGGLLAVLAVMTQGGEQLAPVELATFTVVYLFASAFAALAAELNRRTVRWIAAAHERSDRLARFVGTVANAGGDLTTIEVSTIFDTVVETAAELGADLVGLYVRTDSGLLAYSATHGVPDDLTHATFTPEEGLVGQVLDRDETVVVEDYATYAHAMPAYVGLGLRTALGTPIPTTEGTAGLLILGHLSEHRYDAVEIWSLELLAAHAGRALEIARAYDEQEGSLERLRELDRLKQDFVATVSHELRTPVTIIGGLSETLDVRWGDLPEEQRHTLLRRIRANARALDAIIVKLLDFVRLERGELTTRLEPFDAGALVRATAQRLEPLVQPERTLAVEAEGTAMVRGDERLIERVLENLIVNATRHTPPGSRTTVTLDRDAVVARFTVHDDGQGIPADELERLGERFFRGGDPNSRATGGLGLGLALSNEILRRHGTELSISSRPGQGAAFSFDLPLVRGEVSPRRARPKPR